MSGDGGGFPARRAVTRWAWRLFRRDWRQQTLVLALVTVAVAAALGFACAAYNIAPASKLGRFGTADTAFQFDVADPAHLTAELDAGAAWFGTTEAIGHRTVPVPGAVETVDYRVQDPAGAFSRPMLRLRSGRYPAAAGEVAVTRWVADATGIGVGGALALDGTARTVVGIVENPSALRDRFVLLAPSELTSSSTVEMLVRSSGDLVGAFRPPGDTSRRIANAGDLAPNTLATIVMLVTGTLLLFLVALVAAASFAVLAQRRLTQLGMLAAVGATERHLRLTMVSAGAITGIVASIVGGAIGLGGWALAAPHLEGTVGARIDVANIPWWLAFIGVGLATVATTLAAWWPGRAAARVAPVAALSGRPPRTAPAHRYGVAAGALVAIGVVGLRIGSRRTDGPASTVDLVALCVGIVALVAGMLAVSPLAIRAVARLATRAPIGARLALRDLGRHHARAGAALAALSLALGIPVAIAAAANAAQNHQGPGNLAADSVLLRADGPGGPFAPPTSSLPGLKLGVDAIAAALPGASVVELDVARDPTVTTSAGQAGGTVGQAQPGGDLTISLTRPVSGGFAEVAQLYVATPEVVTLYPGTITPGTDGIATAARGVLRIFGTSADRNGRGLDAASVATPGTLPETYSSLPQALVSPAALAQHGWTAVPSGRWLVRNLAPLTAAQLRTVRELAAQHGLVVEQRDGRGGLADLRHGGVAAGMLLALAVLAMTIGLIRSESAGDLRTLAATGAGGGTRRAVTGVTAGTLTLLGATIGTGGAYLGLAMGRLSALTPLPYGDLALVLVGTPLFAAGAGWLLAGREPPTLARRAIA